MNGEQVARPIYCRVESMFRHNPEQFGMILVALSKLPVPEGALQLEKELDVHGEPLDFDTALKLIEQCYS